MITTSSHSHANKRQRVLEFFKLAAQWIAVLLLLLIYLHSHGWAQGVKPTGVNTVVTAIQSNGANFHITCDAGCGGAASFSDSGAFTAGSTAINIGGGLFDDTPPTAITAGKAAAFRITPNRALHINLRNQSGTELATAGAPLRVDPTGSTTQPVNCVSGCGSAADITASGALGAINNAVQVAMAGVNSASFTLPSGNNLVGTLVAESSSDGGTTWQSTILRAAAANNVWQASVAVSSTNAAFNIQVPGGASHVRVRVSAYTSGTATASLRAVTQPDAVPDPLVQGTQAAGSAVQPNPEVMGGWDGAAVRSLKTDSSGVLQMNLTGLAVACAGLPALTGDITSGSGSCATTLASTLAGLKTFTTGITTKSLNGSVFVSQFASLQAAINNFASGNGTIYIDQNISLSSTTTITGSQPNLTFVCTNGATITSAVNVQFNINGTNTTIMGCSFIGQGPAVATLQAIVVQADTFTFVQNSVTKYGPNGCNGVLELAFGHVLVAHNHFFNDGDPCGDIFVNNTAASTTLSDVLIFHNQAGEIIMHATANNSLMKHIVVVGNDLYPGQNSKLEFGLEIGDFSATQAQGHVADVVSSGNHAYAQANGADGGFSFSFMSNVAESGDVYDANGFTFTIASFEHVLLANAVIQGTISIDGTGGNGLTCDRCQNSAFSSNVINGFCTGANCYGLHTIVSSTTVPSSSDNTFTGNVIIFPAAGAGIGIWEQCNAVGATCNNNNYTGNHVLGPTGTGVGFILENDTGTMTNTNIAQNSFNNLTTGINQVGTRTNVKILDNQFGTVTNAYAGSGTGSFVRDDNQIFAGISINQNGNYIWGTETYASLTGNRTYTRPDFSGTMTMTIVNGTSAMTTAAIAAGACGTTVTTAATNTLTTDAIEFSRNAAATNANGGQLTLNSWPTAGNVNFNYCNPTAGSLTPGAATLNWRVIR